MKTNLTYNLCVAVVLAASSLANAATSSVVSSEGSYGSLTSKTEITSRDPSMGHPYDQLLTIQGGPYHPHSIAFTNWNNNSFTYDNDALNSVMLEMGWSVRLFPVAQTSVYISEGIAYSTMSLKLAKSSSTTTAGNQTVTMHLFGLDTRLVQSWDMCPIAALVPFWEGGYQHTFYDQSGTSDLVAGEGGAGNFVAGLGFRFWLNRAQSINAAYPGRYVSLPIFLTAKVNHIFPNNKGVDPSDTTVLGGVSIGL